MNHEGNPSFQDEFAHLDATAQSDLVRRGEVQPVELVEAAIARIERLNLSLHAVTTSLFNKALAQAVSPHLPDGPFRGVPLLLKDFFCEKRIVGPKVKTTISQI